MFNTPRWIVVLDIAGCFGLLAGLVPSLFVRYFAPKEWMVWMAWIGLWVALVFFAPGFARNLILILRSTLRWQAEQVQQMDHDLMQMRDIRRWLAQFPAEIGTEALRFARQCQARISAKLGLIAGSLDKLGVLPVLAAIAIQLDALGARANTPAWLVFVAIFLATTYLIAITASLMRLRLQLYELVLEDALSARGLTAP